MNAKVVFLEDFLLKDIYRVEEDCNIENFIKKNDLEKFLVIYENGYLKEGDCVFIKKNKDIIHVVKPNETLHNIAFLYGTTEDNIKTKNKITHIFIGQQLII